MADFTVKAIKDTFLTLLEEYPLSEITVKKIVDTCGINRNTFYYHFPNIPALIEEIVKEESDSIISKYPSVDSIVGCFDALTEFATHRKRAIMHIYRSVNRDAFETNLMSLSEHLIKSYMNTALNNVSINATDREAIFNYYKSVCFGLTLEWFNTGMSEKFAKSVRHIFSVKKDMSQEFAMFLKDQV